MDTSLISSPSTDVRLHYGGSGFVWFCIMRWLEWSGEVWQNFKLPKWTANLLIFIEYPLVYKPQFRIDQGIGWIWMDCYENWLRMPTGPQWLHVVKVPLMFWDSWDKIIWCFSPRTDSEFMDVTLIFPTWTCEKECATFRYPFHRFYRGRFLHLGCTAKLQFWWVTWSFLLFFGLLHHEVLWVVAWALAQFQAPQSGQLIDLGSPGSAWSGSSPCLDLFSR